MGYWRTVFLSEATKYGGETTSSHIEVGRYLLKKENSGSQGSHKILNSVNSDSPFMATADSNKR
ncbi:hypothetical protein [Pareuzebyella sediminis]|uniref:hypothetical protein n=1 Tax=Pareuzebyella sediminis TaxID=2607998 RepID=UPI0011EFE44F|nr:hypothetical protein [Pareuzebyella sediminis]